MLVLANALLQQIPSLFKLGIWSSLCVLGLMIVACQTPASPPSPTPPPFRLHTAYSHLPNAYQHFSSPRAINAVAAMENAHFRDYEAGLSRYYGTLWREQGPGQRYQTYAEELGAAGDSMHCTIYAVKALEAGMGKRFEALQDAHEAIWNEREHAGWSLGYLLVKEWNWTAYLVLDSLSGEFDHCMRAFRRDRSYPVWRQPDIPLEEVFVLDQEEAKVQALLHTHEFGWGFSEQGIHTWITRFDTLKECNWWGAPSAQLDQSGAAPLFLKTAFLDYRDYASHVLIFPPRIPSDP